jgi:hypothetical protein
VVLALWPCVALADKAPRWTAQEEAGLYYLLDILISTKACGNGCIADAQYFRNKLIQAPQIAPLPVEGGIGGPAAPADKPADGAN